MQSFNFTKKDVSENFEIFSSSVFLLKNGMHFTLLFSCFILTFLISVPSFSVLIGLFSCKIQSNWF